MRRTETIAAIATAVINSGIGIIRISGTGAVDVAERIYRSPSGIKLGEVPSHTIHYGYIMEEEKIIDEVMVLVMRAPHTYTREDTVEIDCHGGAFLMQEILRLVLKNGARAADPGEFTKRAFLNGRIDLSQAEAVMGLIQAENVYALRETVKQLRGGISDSIRSLREDILYQVAYIESALDDPEHISLEGLEIGRKVDEMLKRLERIIRQSENGRILAEGIRTVILGKPNAGKSSLLNFLVGEERAIVTDVAGTTRDALTEHIMFGGLSLHVVDTAGIRSTTDTVERIGVQKAKEYASEADLIIYMADASVPLDESDREIMEFIRDKNVLVLLNKTDLDGYVKEDELEKLTGKSVIAVSVKEKRGMESLEEAMKKMFLLEQTEYNDEVCITNIRQKEAVRQAYESVRLVKQSVESGMPEDFYTIDLMDAYEELGHVIGESVEDDLIDEIFGKFCTGK